MNLEERLQQLAQHKEKLLINLYEINGAMKILEEQILETKNTQSIARRASSISSRAQVLG